MITGKWAGAPCLSACAPTARARLGLGIVWNRCEAGSGHPSGFFRTFGLSAAVAAASPAVIKGVELLNIELRHPARWDLPPYEAQQLQQRLSNTILLEDGMGSIRTIAGVEIAHSRFNDLITIGIALLSYPELRLIEKRVVEYRTRFPFIPELMSFREVPGILEALDSLKERPDVVMVGGPGIAHAMGLGVASHVGLETGIPTIGCAKSAPVGSFVEPEVNAGASSSLVYHGEIIGTVYRSKNRVAPLFISPGHLVCRETASKLVRGCCLSYRLPEPLRHASNAITEIKALSRAAAVAG